MPTLDEVYCKFGFVSEAAQLLETELGNLLFAAGAAEQNLLDNPNPEVALRLINGINKQTLGRLFQNAKTAVERLAEVEELLERAVNARNRLSHSFYRQHNFRRNTDEGRAVMLNDLESLHDEILNAYKAIMLLSGIDLENPPPGLTLPTRRVPI
jgi:hypothetical protein